MDILDGYKMAEDRPDFRVEKQFVGRDIYQANNINFVQQKSTKAICPPLQKPPRVPNFVGREEELESLLCDLNPCQVITLCGLAGIGKTALVIEAIWQLTPENEPPERFPDGIIFHTFHNKPDADLALEAIAKAYCEELSPSPAEAARRALSGRQALLI
jgi:hypothetical protein